jgi:hypothetical protein
MSSDNPNFTDRIDKVLDHLGEVTARIRARFDPTKRAARKALGKALKQDRLHRGEA